MAELWRSLHIWYYSTGYSISVELDPPQNLSYLHGSSGIVSRLEGNLLFDDTLPFFVVRVLFKQSNLIQHDSESEMTYSLSPCIQSLKVSIF